jgi:haloacetate dehalogenase
MEAAPESIVDDALANWGSDRTSFGAEIRAAYIDALRNPHAAHAICEEYRAAATIDVATDLQDRQAGRRIACPLLVLWSAGGGLDTWYAESGGPLGIWREWANDVSGRAIAGGHFFPEQNPDETFVALRTFFSAEGRIAP